MMDNDKCGTEFLELLDFFHLPFWLLIDKNKNIFYSEHEKKCK